MTGIPRPALLLGLAGLIPFIYGALQSFGIPNVLPIPGEALLQTYGTIILSFMGGCLWGFAAKAGQATMRELGLSVVPALWGLSVMFSPSPLLSLALGFLVLLAIDAMFSLRQLVPDWWMSLRVLLTAIVIACLLTGAFL